MIGILLGLLGRKVTLAIVKPREANVISGLRPNSPQLGVLLLLEETTKQSRLGQDVGPVQEVHNRFAIGRA